MAFVKYLVMVIIPIAFGPATKAQNSTLPVVDLGYELHQASYYNATGNFYNFSNIRYAAPPVGVNRWAPPQPPATNRSAVDDGSVGRICPQASAAWSAISAEWVAQYLSGGQSAINVTVPSGSSFNVSSVKLDPRTTEDCLFLDVVVPKQVLDTAGNGAGAPVLVWIYGGGYVFGDKSGINGGSPAGLLRRSNNGVIYVSLNYRLGAFGFLSGPTFQSYSNTTANAGLHDQRFALNWVKQHIHVFGGDPNRVTVFGESAGAGGIMHQITAYGGRDKQPTPFQQALLQSPRLTPVPSNLQQEQTYDTFLGLLNVSSLDEARQLPSSVVIDANLKQVAAAPYGVFNYGPTVDGDFVPALPGLLLLHGQFDHSLRIMVGHNTNEGLTYTPPYVTNDTIYAESIQSVFPDISPSVLSHITDVLYPPVFNDSDVLIGSYGYIDQISRTALTRAEFLIACNSFYLDTAFKNQTYTYIFAIPPALHGSDIPYTYYNGEGLEPVNASTGSWGLQNVTVALTLQDWIVTFARDGKPSAPGISGVPAFTTYGPDAMIEDLNLSSISVIRDPAANERCKWWQKALYF